jgi:hypothetical protein
MPSPFNYKMALILEDLLAPGPVRVILILPVLSIDPISSFVRALMHLPYSFPSATDAIKNIFALGTHARPKDLTAAAASTGSPVVSVQMERGYRRIHCAYFQSRK